LDKENSLNDRDILNKIAWKLEGVEMDDLTEAEQQIANILIKHGVLIIRENGELFGTYRG
jgi:hypothetical protein